MNELPPLPEGFVPADTQAQLLPPIPEGFSLEKEPTALSDSVKSLLVGVPKGVIGLAGLPGDIAHGFEAAGDWIGDKLGLPPATEEMKRSQHSSQPFGSADIRKGVEGVTGPLYEPQTVPGQFAQAVGEFAPAALAGPGGIVRRLATQAVAPAVASEAAGHAAEGTGFEPVARIAGAIAGGPAVAGSLVGSLRNAVSPQANVAADLGRAIARDKTTPQELLQNANDLSAVRPGVATAADAGGENVRGLVERIAQTPGAGRTIVVPALTQRQQGQMARISSDLQGLTGTRQSAAQSIAETMERRAKDATPIYDEAFNFNAREVLEVRRAWEQETSTGYGRAFLLSPDFRKTLQTEYGIANPADAPLMVQIDAWKKVADDFIGNNLGSNKARVAQAMRQRVLDVIDEHNPKYAEARAIWSGPSQYIDAIKEGREIFNTKVSAEELSQGLQKMNDVNREGYVTGAISAIIGKMGNDPAKLADMTKYLRSPEMRAKIAALMPDANARAAWNNRLNFEVSSSELTGRALGNSATARRLAERHDAENIVGDLVMGAFAGAPPVSLLRRAITAVPQRIRDTLRSKSDHILAELLTDPQSMAGLQKAIERVAASPPARSSVPLAAVNAAQAGEHTQQPKP